MRIDLGGIAKGYAVEHRRVAAASAASSAIVTAGGDGRIVTTASAGHGWWASASRNGKRHRAFRSGTTISSGDYERFFEEDGVRYHHILNQDRQVGDLVRSVTIVGPDGVTDALTKGVWIVGWEGIELIESLDGFETVVIDKDGGLHFSRVSRSRAH